MIQEKLNFNIQKVESSKLSTIDFKTLKFGSTFSDHMFVIDFKDGAWQTPTVKPYGSMDVNPSMSALHYGQAIFEGMKAYKNTEDEVFLFRPLDNIKRFNLSAQRLCMAQIPEEIFLEGLTKLLEIDKKWIPNYEGGSLYIRPFMFATDEYVGVKPSKNYRMIIFTSPVNAYYSGYLKVKVERYYTRAAEGGTGFAKCAGNYAMSLYPAKLAQEEGYDQLIWTDSREHKWIEESGTMNIGFRIGNKILTPPTGNTILKGITRDSVLILAKEMGYEVEERPISIDEIHDLMKEGKVDEAFGMGTAATIAKIETIGFGKEDLSLSNPDHWTFANEVLIRLNNIKKGVDEDKFGWNMKL